MNLHYIFWTEYYMPIWNKDLDTETELITAEEADKNNAFFTVKWEDSGEVIPFQKNAIYMKVQYPGLLTGLGYTHESGLGEKKAKEIKLGISLDPVTGLPYLPGSAVKGLLRTPFLENPSYILACLGRDPEKLDLAYGLEAQIFGKKHPWDKKMGLPTKDFPQGGDVFLDAYPVAANRDGRLLGLDNLTPHRPRHPEGLKNPIPLSFLKLVPDVVLQFRFRLAKSVVGDTEITPEEKLALFTTILEDLGAGAKTNTGFGLLEQTEAPKTVCTYLIPSTPKAPK